MLKLKDILIVRHRESNDREFFFTVKVKEEDITLEQKELIRECTREGVPFDLQFTSGEATTERPAFHVDEKLKNAAKEAAQVFEKENI